MSLRMFAHLYGSHGDMVQPVCRPFLLMIQDRIRQLHRELLKQVRGLYNAPRLVDLLVQGLASKNNRTRVEAAEAMGEIVHDEGVHVADKARHKPLPALAQVRPLHSKRNLR